ncbi:hypothetical protein ACHAWF_016386 [Thalassiosira exigua]
MGGIIDFNTSCPWELYLFAFVHIAAAICMYIFDSCRLLTSTSCNDAEHVFENVVALSLLYVGVIFTVLTYHNKQSADKITRLSNVALNGATALLVSVVFIGNSSFGGIERSWMHIADVLTMIILVAVLVERVSKVSVGVWTQVMNTTAFISPAYSILFHSFFFCQPGAEWAQKNDLWEGMGINCKTLLLLFMALTAIKFVAYCDFIDPLKLLKDGSEMSDWCYWTWKFTAVLIFEVFLAFMYAVLFDDTAGQELLVIVVVVMSVVAAVTIYPVQEHMSSWMGLNGSDLWIRLGIFVLVCLVAIAGGRRGDSDRSGYQTV